MYPMEMPFDNILCPKFLNLYRLPFVARGHFNFKLICILIFGQIASLSQMVNKLKYSSHIFTFLTVRVMHKCNS